jgi:hypothetical protein
MATTTTTTRATGSMVRIKQASFMLCLPFIALILLQSTACLPIRSSVSSSAALQCQRRQSRKYNHGGGSNNSNEIKEETWRLGCPSCSRLCSSNDFQVFRFNSPSQQRRFYRRSESHPPTRCATSTAVAQALCPVLLLPSALNSSTMVSLHSGQDQLTVSSGHAGCYRRPVRWSHPSGVRWEYSLGTPLLILPVLLNISSNPKYFPFEILAPTILGTARRTAQIVGSFAR